MNPGTLMLTARFEKGFTMVEEEELGIAFCTRAKMRRKKGAESQLLRVLRWLFGKLSPDSPQNTTWHAAWRQWAL
eukprot:Skav218536  [mRNA]  locus=scaffold2478:417844:418423:- [translate_table: standard]